MSKLTIKEILATAEGLTKELGDLDTLCTKIQVDAEANHIISDSIIRFQNDMNSLNRHLHAESNEKAAARIENEIAFSSHIVKENIELKSCKEEYERVMEIIMQKYRQHTAPKMVDVNADLKKQHREKLLNIIRSQEEKIDEMKAVMQRAAYVDDDSTSDEIDEISRLQSENKIMRELLQLSDEKPLQVTDWAEKAVQTVAGNSGEVLIAGASIGSIVDVGEDSLANALDINSEQLFKLSLDEKEGSDGGFAAPSPN